MSLLYITHQTGKIQSSISGRNCSTTLNFQNIWVGEIFLSRKGALSQKNTVFFSHSSFQCFKFELLTQLYSYCHNKILFLSNTIESVMITIMKQISNIRNYNIYIFLLSRTSFRVELSRVKFRVELSLFLLLFSFSQF